ncbi:MAG TPA: hypothetical protein VH702_03930 [Vicinamibacterales bacterium]|jgi:hypothetical protein
MSLTAPYSSSTVFGPTLKALAFLLSSFAAIFCASAGYGLLKMLLGGMSRGASIGILEFVTHSGLTIVFLVLAGLSAYGAKKCYW